MTHKNDFPIFKNKKLCYLDNAATSQKPKIVIDAITNFYKNSNANIHRGVYDLSEKATETYENSRTKIAKFINADTENIVFTSGTTESINLLAETLPKLFNKKNEIILSKMEHHSNIVPWQLTAKKNKMKLKYLNITDKYEIDVEDLKKVISNKTAIVSITHISNSLGTINNLNEIIKISKSKGAIVIIDAAQSISRESIDVKKLNCDFLVFSGHKAYGPTGVGVLYGKKYILDKLPIYKSGGDMIDSVTIRKTTFQKSPRKFEAGTQNIAGVIGLGEAINYIQSIGITKIKDHEQELTKYALEKLRKIKDIEIYVPRKNAGIISFNLKDIHPHDVASILNYENIAVRAGHHCCMPLMTHLGIPGTVRISLAIYNDKKDIDNLVKGLKKVSAVFAK